MKKYQTSFLGNWSKCLSIKLCQDFPSLAHLRAQQEDFSTEAVATKTPPAEPWAGSSAICDEGKMQLCAASSWRPEEATEHLVSRMEANASLDLWRIAPSEDMAAQTNARMEGEDPGLTTCISLLEEVSNPKAGMYWCPSIDLFCCNNASFRPSHVYSEIYTFKTWMDMDLTRKIVVCYVVLIGCKWQ